MNSFTKDREIKIRISKQFDEILALKCNKSGLTKSEYIRQSVMNSDIKVVQKISNNTIDDEMRFQFFGIANNINQIAKQTNTAMKQKTMSENTAMAILESLYTIDKNIKQTIKSSSLGSINERKRIDGQTA